MIADDLIYLERSLSLTLPDAYRRIMLDYPFAPDSVPAQEHVLNIVNFIAGLNQDLRSGPNSETPWRETFFAIGTTQGGDPYFLDTQQADSPVFKMLRDAGEISEVAHNFETWIDLLAIWYVDFDPVSAAEKYANLIAAVHAAGFVTTSPEPMDGWDRITIVSARDANGSLSGNSFWVTVRNGVWCASSWGGLVYRVDGDINHFCIAWLAIAPEKTHTDFSDEIKRKFNLKRLSDEEFDHIAGS